MGSLFKNLVRNRITRLKNLRSFPDNRHEPIQHIHSSLMKATYKKAPHPSDERERLAWLEQCSLLDTEPEAEFDEIARLAAQICRAPIAGISLIDQDRQFFKSIIGLDVRETPRDIAF